MLKKNTGEASLSSVTINITTFPARRLDMMPLLATKQSASVVFPEERVCGGVNGKLSIKHSRIFVGFTLSNYDY